MSKEERIREFNMNDPYLNIYSDFEGENYVELRQNSIYLGEINSIKISLTEAKDILEAE